MGLLDRSMVLLRKSVKASGGIIGQKWGPGTLNYEVFDGGGDWTSVAPHARKNI